MPSLPHPDLAGLAMLARSGDRELRPVLLTLHTREFVSAPLRDRRTVATYEALALGLIPLVPDDVVADVSAMLRRVPEAPARVIDLLAARRHARSEPDPRERAASAFLGATEAAELLALGDPAVDLAVARNRGVVLDAHSRRELVGRAARDRALAGALLARPELSAGERGALFRHAGDPAERDRIREEVERTSAAACPNLPTLSAWRRGRILRAAGKGDLAELSVELERAVGLPEPSWNLDEAVEAELFALALVAAGLAIEDCVRVLLTADRRISASVPAVFRLRQVCRTTSRGVARLLLGAGDAPRKSAPASSPGPSRTLHADGARAAAATKPVRRSAGPRASGPAGRRSRSTTGPDRT